MPWTLGRPCARLLQPFVGSGHSGSIKLANHATTASPSRGLDRMRDLCREPAGRLCRLVTRSRQPTTPLSQRWRNTDAFGIDVSRPSDRTKSGRSIKNSFASRWLRGAAVMRNGSRIKSAAAPRSPREPDAPSAHQDLRPPVAGPALRHRRRTRSVLRPRWRADGPADGAIVPRTPSIAGRRAPALAKSAQQRGRPIGGQFGGIQQLDQRRQIFLGGSPVAPAPRRPTHATPHHRPRKPAPAPALPLGPLHPVEQVPRRPDNGAVGSSPCNCCTSWSMLRSTSCPFTVILEHGLVGGDTGSGVHGASEALLHAMHGLLSECCQRTNLERKNRSGHYRASDQFPS